MSVDTVFASGPTYRSGSYDYLMPFTYRNGKLDLPASTGYPSGTAGVTLGNAGVNVRILGGANQVTSIGTNLQSFVKNNNWGGYTVSGTITVASPAIVTRVQQLSQKYLPSSWDQTCYKVTPSAWDGANFIGNNPVYLFNKPLVLQCAGTNGVYTGPICITLQTYWDH